MITIEKTEVMGWEAAIRGMRNPKNSWDRSDSYKTHIEDPETLETSDYQIFIGDNDKDLMLRLAKGGSVHAKYRRMILVTCDITAPLYWWKEFDTYKVGTVANSCSTMHKIHDKPFTVDDFSHEHLTDYWNDETQIVDYEEYSNTPRLVLEWIVDVLNHYREMFLKTGDKKYWWQMIQLLPSSYNQKRTVLLNYEVLAGIYPMRKDHKLDEWHTFCDWIHNLPHSDVIVGAE
jgi:hypothetical protein